MNILKKEHHDSLKKNHRFRFLFEEGEDSKLPSRIQVCDVKRLYNGEQTLASLMHTLIPWRYLRVTMVVTEGTLCQATQFQNPN